MARPRRCRRICLEPVYNSFSPCGVPENGQVLLNVEEYEVIRLIDLEKKTHVQCAGQMGISRTTVTEMYEIARFKIADCIVNGKMLYITGGNYQLCDGSARQCCGKECSKITINTSQTAAGLKGVIQMKLAVTYENGTVFQHFGHTEQFKIYEIENNEVVDTKVVDTTGSGHGALAGLLGNLQVETLICGGIGAGAQNALEEAGIQFYGGVTGDADEAVKALLAGNLSFNPNVHCNHHGHNHEHGHSCGTHQCGEDKHGCGGN